MNVARETLMHMRRAPKGQGLPEGRRKLSGERIATGRVSEINSSPRCGFSSLWGYATENALSVLYFRGGSRMSCRRVLVTNNPLLKEKVDSCDFVTGSSLDVLVRTRDFVHEGWVLLSHPLYGNLRPHQHPYRSILAETTQDKTAVDLLSLEYIENAIAIYSARSTRILLAEGMPEAVRQDFAFIDGELMKDSLSRYGMFVREVSLNRAAKRR